MRLALLGGGSIARVVADAIADGRLPGVEVTVVAGASEPTSKRTQETAERAAAKPGTIDELVSSSPDWVLEAAGATGARAHLPRILESGCNAIVMSIGALLEPDIWSAVQLARTNGQRVVLPSGAIGGLDAVAAMGVNARVNRANITSTKKPAGLAGAPYLSRNGIELPIDRAVQVFDGTAREAVRGFPANVNVAAALSFAGVGPELTRVTIVSDPAATLTRHVIEADGEAGRIRVEITAKPNPRNPKSSWLAGLSAAATIRDIAAGAR